MKTYWTLLAVIASFWFCSCYQEFHCPFHTEWKVRAKWYCNSSSTSRYTCLFNEFTNKYEEACKYKPDLLDLGEQYVISHLPRGAKCKTGNKYQPFPLAVNISSECVLRKSQCNEEGQVLFYNGSSKEDRSCRCDFENGFAFLYRPKHQCKCLPAMEDCSCYRKYCFAHFTLTPDYSCIHKTNRTYISPCPGMAYESFKSENPTSKQIPTSKTEDFGVRSNIAVTVVPVIIGAALTGTFCFIVVFVLSKRLPNLLYVDFNTEIGPPYNPSVTKERTSLKLTWSKPEKCHEDIKEYRIYCCADSTLVKEFTVEGADNLCFWVTQNIFEFEPRKTYRFQISAWTFNLKESKLSNEVKIDTKIPDKLDYFKAFAFGGNGSIKVAWATPNETLYIIDKFELHVEITSYLSDDEYTEWLSPDVYEHTIVNAEHKNYRFVITAWSKGVAGEYNSCLFTGDHAFHGALKLTVTNIVDKRVSQLLHWNKQEQIRNRFDDGFAKTQGTQELLYERRSEGCLFLELVFTSRDFNDEIVISQTLKNTFENISIEEWDLTLTDFSCFALNKPAPPQSVEASNVDNVVTVTWKEPVITFFKTEKYIIQIQQNNELSTFEKQVEVPAHQLFYIVPDVLPSTVIEFIVFTGICHSVISRASVVTSIHVEGPTPPQDVRATNKGSRVHLSWTKPRYPNSKFVKQFKIKILEKDTISYVYVRGDRFKYTLSNCKSMTNYSFELSTVTSNNIESMASETIVIGIQGPIPLQDVEATKRFSGVTFVVWRKRKNLLLSTIGQQSTFNINDSIRDLIQHVHDLLYLQGPKPPNHAEAKYEGLRVVLWRSPFQQYIVGNITIDIATETGDRCVSAQAAIQKWCPQAEDDSIWLYEILDIIGMNEHYRKTCKRACIISEILVSFDNMMTCYNIGSGIEGTNTLGEPNDLEVMQCDETLIVIDDIAKADQNHMFLLTVTELDNHVRYVKLKLDNHVGYVKLQLVLRGIPCTSKHFPFIESVDKGILRTDKNDRLVIIDSPHVISKPEKYYDISIDTVKSYKCRSWPKIANEWLSRHREHGWPTEDTIKEFELLGFFVVRKGHPYSSEIDLEWRVSFCLQERKLMFNLTDVQHKCYILLKLFNQEIIHLDWITYYHWKTCLFYVIERHSANIWTKEYLLDCLRLCVKQMLEWVKGGFCPDYFIPRSNLFDGRLNARTKLTSETILTDLLNLGFDYLFSVAKYPIWDYVRSRGSTHLFQVLRRNSERVYREAVYTINTSTINSVLRVFNHKIIEHYFYQVNEPIFFFIEYLWQTLDHIEHIDVMTGHTTEETKRSLSLLKPHIYTCLASNIAAMAVQHPNDQVRDFLLFESFTYLSKGGFSGVLKFISVLYAIGMYTECEWYLYQQDEEYIRCTPSLCNCRLSKLDSTVTPTEIIDPSTVVAFPCVTFVLTELPIIPDALKFEMFRHLGIPLSKNEGTNIIIRWHNRSAIDSNIYYFLLKYLVNRKLGKPDPSNRAIHNILRLISGGNVRHRDVAFNVLAWVFFKDGFTSKALQCLQLSWSLKNNWNLCNSIFTEEIKRIHYHCNSAKLHALVIIYKTWFVRKPTGHKFCFQCFDTIYVNSGTCSRCKISTYCSKQCQRKNWEVHRKVCKNI